MVFSSLVFLWLFLPIVIGIYYISDKKYNNIFLLVSSLFFYAWDEPFYIILMILSIIINYYVGLKIEFSNSKRNLTIGVILNLLILGYFKYCPLFVDFFHFCGINFKIKTVTLPVGISFYTFQSISYLIDVYRKQVSAQTNILKMGLFISFFPQLIAGPILKYHDIASQIDKRKHSWKLFNSGACKFILGLSKKVLIANVMAETADDIFNLPVNEVGTVAAWAGVFAYTMQIYFDFSGYSDMAIGLGRMFGFNIQKNFKMPYISKSIQEFWRRWHISLSSWFKEYLYIPLGGSRGSKIKNYRNLLIVFFCTGLWHGASLNFILWGMFHGFFIILEKIIPIRKILRFSIFQNIYTMAIVLFGWIIFRIEKSSDIFPYMKQCFSSKALIKGYHYLDSKFIYTGIFAIIFCGMGYLLCNKIFSKEKQLLFIKAFRPVFCAVLLFLSILSLVKGSYNPLFISGFDMVKIIDIINRSFSGLLLLLAVFVPFVFNIFSSNTQLLDNRPLFEKPNDFSRSFFQKYEKYYNDTIACRQFLVEMYSKIYDQLGMLSGIYFSGNSEYMFLNADRSFKDYFGIDFIESEKQSIISYINKVSKFCQDRQIKYLFVSCPNKERIYSEFMPKGFKLDRLTEVSATDKILKKFEKDRIALSLTQCMLMAKNNAKYPIYYEADTHWNGYGSYSGFLEIMKTLNEEVVKYFSIKVNINLIKTVMKGYLFSEHTYDIELLNDIKVKNIKNTQYFSHYKSENAPIKKKVLIIRDSFSCAMFQYFVKTFSEVIFVHCMSCKSVVSEIEKYKPDIVIDQTVERYVLNRSKL